MIGDSFVRPLEDDWRETLDRIARRRRWPTSRDVERLAERVAALSRAYNDPARSRAPLSEAGAARLAFSFVRDVPKGAAAVRELVATGAVDPGDGETWRVLDVGAGLGAMTWGVVRALRAAGRTHRIHATWLDEDGEALRLGSEIVRERALDLQVRGVAGPVDDARGLGRFDLVIVGDTLTEIGVALPEEARTLAHVEILRRMLDRHVDDRGALIVVEPALRDRTRRLHRVRDALTQRGFSVFAPCLHSAPCPALARESDWCHEDLTVDLPDWLSPIARAAGLRRQGLTFSYLVLKRSGVGLAAAMQPLWTGARLRVVSDRRVSKGKCEAFLCGEFHSAASAPVVARARVARLDRDRTTANEAWDELRRGDVIEIDPSPDVDRPRVLRATAVRSFEVPR